MRCNPTQVGADPASPGGYAAGFAQIGLGIGCCRARVARPAQQIVRQQFSNQLEMLGIDGLDIRT